MTRTFQRFAGTCSILVGIGGLAYGVLFGFIVYGAERPVALVWLALGLLGALLGTPVAVALYMKLRDRDWGFALLALLLGIFGSVGQLQNSALTLAKEVGELRGESSDPAGAFRFGLLGLSLLIVGWLIVRSGAFPKRLGYLAEVGGVLLVLTFLGRTTGLIDTANELSVLPPVLYGVVIHPVLYVWLGRVLRKDAG
ncbi:MAG: DUF4386 family protein [Actinomycetota bacterium]